MQFYLCQGNYTQDAIKNLVAHPEDRSKAVAKMCEDLGGKLHHFFMSFGEHDFTVVIELPDDDAAAALAMGTSAVGHVSGFKTTKLITPQQAVAAMTRGAKVQASLKPPKGK
ncbi:MAG: GYD domain-containing protein [Methylobacteriaceae bacterium]|nr:GYD domain-containing protein [Methylobacteriaceae bacterium]MBV9702383.1 GYD domain-containing protein [Methylobacteriaceae bacterium]